MLETRSDRVQRLHSRWLSRLVIAAAIPACADELDRESMTSAAVAPKLAWQVVVNNGVQVPSDARNFNSYNQPSINIAQLVVFRARSRGGAGGEPAHGVFARDMAARTSVISVFDRTTVVPQPNNLGTTFVEPPSFPRIDMSSDTIASRGGHPPVWEYMLPDGSETRAGTTGIYTNPFGALITGASNVGAAPGFEFFAVPYTSSIKFDVFPGAPAVTDGGTIVFKGNHTDGGAQTGVYYRDLTDAAIPGPGATTLAPAGGTSPVILIADTKTLIPGTSTLFGSTAPPSAAGRRAVFAGFDIEAAPTLGGIYQAPLSGAKPPLTALVKIGDKVPGETNEVFDKLGEGLSFDGRFVAFWGAWGSETRALLLVCPTEGNRDRVAYCNAQHPDGFATTVPANQGIFVHDTWLRVTYAVAKTADDFDDFVYWNFSGRVPGTGGSEDDDGEPARWRSASFVAVSGLVYDGLDDATFHAAFKARTGATNGIYLRRGPGRTKFQTVVETGMSGTVFDPAAVASDEETGETVVLPVTEMGIERDGFRGSSLVVNVSMGTEEAGWAGIYLTTVR